MAGEHLRRPHPEVGRRLHPPMALPRVVDALEEVRHPADATLGQGDPEAAGSGRRRRRAAGRRRGPSSCRPAACSGPSPGSRRSVPVIWPDVPKCMHSGSPASSTAASTGSQARLCQLGQAQGRRVLGEAHRLGSPRGSPLDLGHARRHVPEREQHERDLTAGIEAAPLVDHEVVVGLHAEQREARGPGTRGSVCRRSGRRRGSTAGPRRRRGPCPCTGPPGRSSRGSSR